MTGESLHCYHYWPYVLYLNGKRVSLLWLVFSLALPEAAASPCQQGRKQCVPVEMKIQVLFTDNTFSVLLKNMLRNTYTASPMPFECFCQDGDPP